MKQERTYSLSSRMLFRGKLLLDHISNSWTDYIRYKMSRDFANRTRKRVVSAKGRKVVDRKLKKRIKEYSREAFGSASYWPWLALFTEMRGEFKEGWMPDDYYRFELLPGMNPEKYMRFSEAKILDHKLFNGAIVEPLFFRTDGHYYNKEGEFRSMPEIQEILTNLNEDIIVKPDAGRSGKHILFRNSKELDLMDLSTDTNLLFQKIVQQHPELKRLYPYSVNTFRVTTLIDEKGAIKIKYVIIRFGRGGSRVDNMSSGGCCVFVHPNGKIEPNAYDNMGLNIGDHHPDTGKKFSELNVPNFDTLISFCKQAHRNFPYTRIIGWDVFIDEKAEPKLIEWNANNPGLWVEEALYGPFFSEVVRDS